MGRRAIFEGVHEESKLCLGTLLGEPEHLKHALLQLRVVDTDAAATHLDAVAHEIVGQGTHLLGMLVEQRQVVGVGHGERMVRGHEALLLVAPLKEREVDNPQTLKHVFVAQPETLAHLKTEVAKLHARLVGVVARENQHEVTVVGTHQLLDVEEHLGSVKLVDRAFHRAIGLILDIDQSLGTHLRTLHEIGQFVELLATIVGTARHADTADIGCLVEDRELALAFEGILKFDELHAKPQVGLVGAKPSHGLVPCHALQLGQLHATDFLEQMAGHRLEEIEHVVLIDEAHLAVDLRKLGLAVGTQVLVAETLGNLEVAVDAGHHEQLLERLRTLGQCIKLSGVHTRRHHEIAGTLGR